MPLFAPYQPDARGSVGPGVVVRPAEGRDVVGIVAVAQTRGPQPEGHADRVAAWVGDPARLVLVADHDGDIVGWAMAAWWSGHQDAPDGHYVSALTVLPDWWRRGVGSRMMTDLLEWVWQRADEMWSVINVRNASSVAIHARHGFGEVSRAARFAGIAFDGGLGVLLRAARPEEG